jgi:transcriptional regulator with XRE-family HTH domain
MILTQELKGLIVAKGYTQETIAGKLGMSTKTFYSRMKTGKFGSDEIEVLIEILDIKNPIDIFFAKRVT